MDPRYFAHTLTLYEAELFCLGLQRRRQLAWEVARYQAYYSAAPHCKDFTPDKMGRFPWDEDGSIEQLSEEEELQELAALRARAAARDAEFLKRNGKQSNGGRRYVDEAPSEHEGL